MKRLYNIDASSLVTSSCMLRWKRIVVDGYTDKLPFNDTLYGSAFHMFQATLYRTNGDMGEAIKAALEVFSRPKEIRGNKKYLDEQHLIKTCHDAFMHYREKDTFQVFSIEGKAAVEIEFRIPYIETDDYIVNLCGTIDKFGQFPGGMYAIGDYKTHALSSVMRKAKDKGNPEVYIDAEMKEYFKQYVLAVQFHFYLFCLTLMASKNPDGELYRIMQAPVGFFIDGVFISSTERTRFKRSDITTPSKEFLQTTFKHYLSKKISALVSLPPDYNDMDGLVCGACNDQRFACKFATVCAAPSDIARGFLLTNNFRQKPYDPLTFAK